MRANRIKCRSIEASRRPNGILKPQSLFIQPSWFSTSRCDRHFHQQSARRQMPILVMTPALNGAWYQNPSFQGHSELLGRMPDSACPKMRQGPTYNDGNKNKHTEIRRICSKPACLFYIAHELRLRTASIFTYFGQCRAVSLRRTADGRSII